MSLGNDLLIILTNYSAGYKLMRKELMGIKVSQLNKINYQKLKEQTLRTTLFRLKKCGLIKNESAIWIITEKGKEYLKNKSLKIPHFKYLKIKDKKRNMVIIFDIPELRRKQRTWLRGELLALNFISLQKSVWFGPAPLPKEFIEYLSEINLLPYLKFFKTIEENIV
ncbi:MAG: hypothetical protein V1910_02305 [bacterium]